MTAWHMPHRRGGFYRRPFTHTTTAEADWMRLLADDGHTFTTALDRCDYAPAEATLCRTYIDAGHGDQPMGEWIA